MIVLDTDHMSLLEWKDSPDAKRLDARLQHVPPHEMWTTIISYEEQVRGWTAAIAKATSVKEQVDKYRRLHRLLTLYCSFQILEFDEKAAVEYQRLRKQYKRLASMDLKIAAIVIARKGKLLSRNTRDFTPISELTVEDWTREEIKP